MQPTKNEESLRTGIGSRAQPTKEQVEYARGFENALDQIYAKRGAPVAVGVRSQSTKSDLLSLATSNSASLQSADRGQTSSSTSGSSVACTAVLTGVRSQSLLAVVTDMMAPADPQAAPTTIPLCVVGLESNDFDHRLLGDEPQHQQPTSNRNSTGMKNVC